MALLRPRPISFALLACLAMMATTTTTFRSTTVACAFSFSPAPPSPSVLSHRRVAVKPLTTTTTSLEYSSGDNVDQRPLSSRFKARRPSLEGGLRYRSDDWLSNFLSIPNSFLLKRIQFHLNTNMFIALCVTVCHMYVKEIAMPLLGHSLLGSFLGLLMVFRTNSAYARYYEGRTVWSKLRATCHNLALSIVAHIVPHSPTSSARLLELLAAYPDALAYACLGGSAPLSKRVTRAIPETPNLSLVPATKICLEMHRAVHAAAEESATSGTDLVEAMHITEIGHEINSLVTTLTSCEKIVRTPVPWSYSRHTSRFLTIWCGTLPFALVGTLGWLTLPVVAVTCWCLFGIEEIGHLIEQPFVGDSVTSTRARAVKTEPYDIGMPVEDLARRCTGEVLQISGLGVQ